MRMIRKRITAMMLSALLATSAAAEALPPINVFAADGVTVNMTSLGIPVLNKANYQHTQTKNNYLYTKNGKLNPGYKMRYYYGYNLQFEKSGDSTPQDMASGFNRVYKKKDNGTWWRANYLWIYGADSSVEGFNQLMTKGDIRCEMSGLLALDKHSNFLYHWSKQEDKAILTLYQNGQILKQYKNSSDDGDLESTEYGRGEWINPQSGLGTFQVDYYHDNCGCGSSSVKNAVLAFADTTYPKITNVSTNSSTRYFNQGTIDITITFDESIRFADGATDNKTADATNELVLDAYDRQTNRTLDDVTAQLVSLDINKLTYRYTVPEGHDTDIVIRGIAGADRQTMFNNAHDLYLYTADGSYENLYTEAQYSSIATVQSPFTDLAGNPISEGWSATGFNGDQEIYVDTVSPTYASTDISGSMMKGQTVTDGESWPEDIDRSQVFAGVGDTLTFMSMFDEEIDVDPAAVTAVLNIKDGNGNNVTVKGVEEETVSTGVNSNIKVTRLTFEPLTITSDMVPEDDGQAIRIKTVELPSGASDLCGNAFADSTIEVKDAPRQQEWLDTVAPGITSFEAIEEESNYSGSSEPVPGFCVPVQITEQAYDSSIISDADDSQKYMSGTNAVGDGDQAQESGVIILNDPGLPDGSAATYEYCVTTTSEVPTGGWQKAMTGEEAAFTQIDNGNYIHIRLAQGSEAGLMTPVITIKGYDYAGNYASQEITADVEFRESILPETDVMLRMETQGTAWTLGNINVSDKSGITDAKYKIEVLATDGDTVTAPETPTVEAVEAGGSDWITANLGNVISSKADITVDSTNLEPEKNNFVYVHVYAKDRCGNATVETHEFNFNLMLPSFSISVPQGVSDGTVAISKLNKEEAKKLGWAVERIQNVNFDQSMAGSQGDSAYIQSYGSLYVVVKDPKDTNKIIGLFVDDLTDANNERNEDTTSFQPVSKPPYQNLEITDLLSQLDPSEDEDPVVIDYSTKTGYFPGGMRWESWGVNFTNDTVGVDASGNVAEFASNRYQMGNTEYISGVKESISETAEKLAHTYGEIDIYTMVIDSKWIIQQNHNSEAEQDLSWIRFMQMPQTERNTTGFEGGIDYGGNAAKPVALQKYTVKSARDDGVESNPINTATFNALRDKSGRIISDDDPRLTPEGTTPGFTGTQLCRFQTLAGLQLSFTVGNNRMADWGIEDIDFENSYVTIYRDGIEVSRQQLQAGSAEQLLIFPDNIDYDSGIYKVGVTLKAKVSGRIDEIDLGKTLNVDSTMADAGAGFKKLTINLEDPAIGEYIVTDGTSDDTLIESIVMPSQGAYQYIEYESDTIDTMTDSGYGGLPIGIIKMWFDGHEDSAVFIEGKSIQLINQEGVDAQISYDSVYVPTGETTVLCYQEVLWNGEITPVRQISITVGSEKPELDLEVMPNAISQSVQLKVNSLYSMNGDIAQVYAFKNGDLTTSYSCAVTETGTLSIDGVDTFTEPDLWSFLVIDETGAYIYDQSDNIDLSRYIDNNAPQINVSQRQSCNGTYSFTLSANDAMPYADVGDLRLYISTADPATEDAPDPSATEGTESVTEPDDTTIVFDWATIANQTFGDSSNPVGIYSMSASYSENEDSSSPDYGHNIEASFEGQVPQSGSLYVWAEDAAGNMSAVTNLFSGVQYEAPAVTGISRADDGSLALKFSSGVRMTDPIGTSADTTFSTDKTGIPIYTDGIHSITYEDIFGQTHTESIEVALDGEFRINYEMTPSVRTNGDVTLNISSARDDGLLTITNCAIEGGGEYETSIAEDAHSVSVVMKDNGKVTVSLDYGGQVHQRVFTVDNIDREVGAVIVWEYAETIPQDGETSTDGSVIAHVRPTDENDELTGTNGSLSHTFTSGSKGDTYTFEFTDQAGNHGSIEAVLPVNIELPEPVSLSYDMRIYAETNSQLKEYDQYSYDAESDYVFETLPNAQSYMISINPNVSSRILILPAGTTAESITDSTVNDEINGVTLMGSNINVTDNANFVIGILADEGIENYDQSAPRAIAIPVNITNITSLGEVGVVYANLNKYSVRAYFDPKGQDITVTNATGVGIESEHKEYMGYYYHDFTQNGSFIFYYRDSVGNTGSVTAIVNDLLEGDIAPADPVSPLRWWPYKVNDADGADQSEIYDSPVNYDVTAQVRFNMNVTEATLLYKEGDSYGDPVTTDIAELNVTLDLVDITYKQNTEDTVLYVRGENGSNYWLDINAVNIIDKTPPEITNDYTPGTLRQSVDITFTPNERVICSQISSPVMFEPGSPIKVTVDENGTYTYSFTDSAGNVTNVTVVVTDIDTTPPELSFRLTADGTVYNSWETLVAENDVTDIASLYISSNESGRYTFQETGGSINANEWAQLTVEKNGIYPLNVWDTAGNMTFTGLYGILVPDNTAPTLWLSPQRISVAQGISDAELQNELAEGVLVSDNVSSADNISVTWDLSSFNANTPGEYQVIYTAKDETGNTATASRIVRVVGSDEVTLSINNNDTTYMGTLILDTNTLNFSVGNLANSNGVYEPYALYIKKGFKTAGQMKNGSTRISGNSTTVTGSGFYTVYVMTQNRRQYITYLYIEQ